MRLRATSGYKRVTLTVRRSEPPLGAPRFTGVNLRGLCGVFVSELGGEKLGEVESWEGKGKGDKLGRSS